MGGVQRGVRVKEEWGSASIMHHCPSCCGKIGK